MRVQANLQQLASYGLNIDDLRTTIANNNSNAAQGQFRRRRPVLHHQRQRPAAERRRLRQHRGGLQERRAGASVRCRHRGRRAPRTTSCPAGPNKTPAVLINVQRQPGANVIAVVDPIKEILPQIQAGLPGLGGSIRVLTDRTNTIRASVADVEFELMLAVVLVVLVIFVFLRNLPATFIPSLSVPLSIVGTFAAMYLLGFSLNNLSLMALTISAGFVVDDAIVMIENITRYLEKGDEAARRGDEGRRRNRLHHRVADRLADRGADPAAVHAGSGGPAVPRIRRHPGHHHPDFGGGVADPGADAVRQAAAQPMRAEEKHQGNFQRRTEEYYERFIAEYDRLLIWVLDHQPLTMLVAVGTLVLTVLLYILIPKGFFPLQDTGFIQAITTAGPTVSFDEMARRQQRPGATRSWRTRMSPACPPSSAWTAPTTPSTAAAS